MPMHATATRDPVVLATATALPPHRYDQAELARVARALLPALETRPGVLERFFSRVGVESRHLALPLEAYADLKGLEAKNRAWLEVATGLGEEVVGALLGAPGVDPADVGEIVSTTVTGLAVPSLEARLMNRLPLPRDARRVPLFGLGCAGGVAGLARAADFLRAFPDRLAILLSVELCSLTVQREDVSVANVISTGLFGDGAAAVLLAGADHPLAARAGPAIVDSRSAVFPDTERVMGWDFVDTGFQIVLSTEVPDLAREALPREVDALLGSHGLGRDDVATWVTHPGGPAVLRGLQAGLGLDDDALAASWEGLARVGNLSSASVLFLLDTYRRERRPAPGSAGLMIAMGPAFAAELALLRW